MIESFKSQEFEFPRVDIYVVWVYSEFEFIPYFRQHCIHNLIVLDNFTQPSLVSKELII